MKVVHLVVWKDGSLAESSAMNLVEHLVVSMVASKVAPRVGH